MSALISILQRFINSDMTKTLNTMIDEVKSTLALVKTKTDLITSNLFTSTHASRIDVAISSRQADAGLTSTHVGRIDASISSRALETTAQAIKAKTDLLSAGLGGIKSVQRGTIIMKFNEGSQSVAISSVNLAKSVLILSNTSLPYGADNVVTDASGQISSATSLLFTRKYTASSSNDGNYIDWQVIEFY